MPDELTMLRAQVELLREAHELANDALRSAKAVAERRGAQTNWESYIQKLDDSLTASHHAMRVLAATPPYKPQI